MKWITILLFLLLVVAELRAQLNPGVTENDFDNIENAINAIYGTNKYEVSDIINIDSASGKRWVSENSVENAFGTLQQCYVFTAVGKFQGDNNPCPKGFIGVFKNGQIIWHCDPIINDYDAGGAGFFDISDINRDGKVELSTSWLEGMRGDSKYIWIFGWDGLAGTQLNDVDTKGKSVIRSYSDRLGLIDINGDGIKEFQGLWVDNLGNDAWVTYSWNGQKYGIYPVSPPPSGVPNPRNRVDVDVKTRVQKKNDKYKYDYTVTNKNTSLQKIENFFIIRFSDSISNINTRRDWRGDLYKTPFGIMWTNLFTGENYIMPGDVDTNFQFLAFALPIIVTSYVQGNNGGNGFKEILTNSAQVGTIGPATPPDPFVPLTFLDTLAGYTNQSRTLGWIKDSLTAVKYLGYFSTAKAELQQNDTATAKSILRQVLTDVDVDSTNHITSEAYALLRFNTEYLIPRIVPLDTLRVPSQYATIQAAINMADSGRTILVSAGTYNELVNISSKKSLKLVTADTNVVIQGVTISNSSNITVKGFKIYASGTSQDAVQLTGTQNRNIIIEANDIQYSSRNGITIGQNNDTVNIVNNVIANNNQNGINFTTGALGTQYVVNNTIVKNGMCGIEAVGPQKLLIVNNIIIYDTLAGRSGERLVRGAGTTYIMEKNNLVLRRQNGVLQSDYRLVPGSIAIDKGTTNFALLPTKDKDGNPRVSGTTIDVGAYEYQQ
jgi:hypothetical protein